LAGNAEIARMLNAETLASVAEYAERFAAAQPFPHVVIDDFLSEPLCSEFCRPFPPFSETADEHSTVYVERHLPERFASGYTLSEEDVSELRGLLTRRDQHLQRLYRQVQDANRRINRSRLYSAESGLRRRIHEFEKATGWPIAKPLRALRRRFSRGPGGTGGSSRQDD
jgi:hypothetical protein